MLICLSLKSFHEIMQNIIKIVTTWYQIVRPKCTEIDFCWNSAQTPLGSLQRSPESLAGIKGTYFWWKGEREGKGGKEKRKKGWGPVIIFTFFIYLFTPFRYCKNIIILKIHDVGRRHMYI